jgi:hypothetical protein
MGLALSDPLGVLTNYRILQTNLDKRRSLKQIQELFDSQSREADELSEWSDLEFLVLGYGEIRADALPSHDHVTADLAAN